MTFVFFYNLHFYIFYYCTISHKSRVMKILATKISPSFIGPSLVKRLLKIVICSRDWCDTIFPNDVNLSFFLISKRLLFVAFALPICIEILPRLRRKQSERLIKVCRNLTSVQCRCVWKFRNVEILFYGNKT